MKKKYILVICSVFILFYSAGAVSKDKISLVRLVLDDNDKGEVVEEEVVISAVSTFEYSGELAEKSTNLGVRHSKDIEWREGKIRCKEEDGEITKVGFAVFADDECGYEKAKDKCRLLHCVYDVAEEEAQCDAIDRAVIRTANKEENGIAAMKWVHASVVGKKQLEEVHPEDLKAMFFCNPGEEHEIDVEDDNILALMEESPLNVTMAKAERKAEKLGEEKEIARIEEENERTKKKVMTAIGIVAVCLVLVGFVLLIYFTDKKYNWVRATASAFGGMFTSSKKTYDATEEARTAGEPEPVTGAQLGGGGVGKRQEALDRLREVRLTKREPEYGSVEWAYSELEIEPDYPITEDFVDSCARHCRKKWHPDKFSKEEEFSPKRRKTADVKFKNIAVAVDVLKKHIRANSN